MPLVALEIWLEVSLGIRAVRGGVAQTHGLDLFAQGFPVQVQGFIAQGVQILL